MVFINRMLHLAKPVCTKILNISRDLNESSSNAGVLCPGYQVCAQRKRKWCGLITLDFAMSALQNGGCSTQQKMCHDLV
jgi:hypothetical protein